MRAFVRGTIATAILGLTVTLPPAPASGNTTFDDEGWAEVSAPPFSVTLQLSTYEAPSELDVVQTIEVNVDLDLSDSRSSLCEAGTSLNVIPLRDGMPIEAGVPIDEYSEDADVSMPVGPAGVYAVRIEGTYSARAPGAYSCSAPVQYSATIDMFTLAKPLQPRASTTKVSITSSGSHVIVASSRGRSRTIGISFVIKDPERRNDLTFSVCAEDWDDDCWADDVRLAPSSSTKRTSTGWVKQWGYWWARVSPGTCIGYYLNEPDVSIGIYVYNRDGELVGRKKHSVRLTCRT